MPQATVDAAAPLEPAAFIARARAEGLHLVRDGERLRVTGPADVRKRPAVVRYLRRFKSEIVAVLPSPDASGATTPLSQPREGDPLAAATSFPSTAAWAAWCIGEMTDRETDPDVIAAFADAYGLPVTARDWRPLLEAVHAGTLPALDEGERVPLSPGVTTSDPALIAERAERTIRSKTSAGQASREAAASDLDALAAWYKNTVGQVQTT